MLYIALAFTAGLLTGCVVMVFTIRFMALDYAGKRRARSRYRANRYAYNGGIGGRRKAARTDSPKPASKSRVFDDSDEKIIYFDRNRDYRKSGPSA